MSSTKKILSLIGGGTIIGLGYGIYTYFASDAPEEETWGTFEDMTVNWSHDNQAVPSAKLAPEFRFALKPPPIDSTPILILYGTEYGFSEELARKLQTEISELDDKMYPRVVSMEEYEVVEWEKERIVFIICSTYGDGVPPTRARKYFDWLEANDIDYSHIRFATLALGDKSYPHYARSGKVMEELYEKHKADKVHQIATVDMEDWPVIDRWFNGVIKVLQSLSLEPQSDYLWDKVASGSYQKAITIDRSNPYYARVVTRELLTNLEDTNDKETIHVEIDLGESALEYIVGDSLGILPLNDPSQVDEVLQLWKVNPEEQVSSPNWNYPSSEGVNSESRTLREALLFFYDLKNLKPKLLQLFLEEAQRRSAPSSELGRLQQLMAKGLGSENVEVTKYLEGRELVDILENFPSVRPPASLLLPALGQLLPRYYSISSSMVKDPTKVTVTVAMVRYKTFERNRIGICSTYVNDRIQVGDVIPVFVNCNPDFRLPSDPSKTILMIGPGTGIAPFRAMLQERVHLERSGRNILYFGCRSPDRDFLYKDELEQLVSQKKLELHTAFSRTTEQKIYVQHKLKANSKDVWDVLEDGGHVYVCGDAEYMAVDVHKTLQEIIAEYGKMAPTQVDQYLASMEAEKRYQKDVWF